MKKLRIMTLLTICTLILSADYTFAAISSFDSNLDGWTSNTSGEVRWSSTGGNPDGYTRFVDGSGSGSWLFAPDKFLGDWSSLDGNGSIIFDHRIFNTGPNVGSISPYRIKISGSGGSAAWYGVTPAGQTPWVNVTALIDERYWNITSGNWDDLLSEIDSFQIAIEMVTNPSRLGEITGIDNVVVTPLPASLWFFATSLIGLTMVRRKKNK